MRVAYFLNDFPSMSQTFVLNQITGLIDLGAEVEIFSFRKNPSDTVHEIVYRYGLLEKVTYIHGMRAKRAHRATAIVKKIFTRGGFKNLLPVLKGLNIVKFGRVAHTLQLSADIIQITGNRSFDIVHCQFGTIANRVLNLIEAGGLSGKLVTSFRGYDATRYALENPGIYTRLFVKGDHFLPVSQSLSETIKKLGCSQDKITVIHSGITLEHFEYQKDKYPEHGPLKVITVARLVEKKGIEYSIRSIATVADKGKDLLYTIVGDGELLEKLQRLVDQLGVNDRVIFAGWKTHSEVIDLLSDSHILLAPSITATDGDQEGIPNVMKEAMAMGLPVIGTIHGGTPELVQHEKTGFLVAERDSESMADYLLELCNKPDIWPGLCRQARQFIELEFDSLKLNQKLLNLYHDLSRK